MKSKGIKYAFTAKVWKHGAAGGWHFVSMPEDLGKEIREQLQWQEEGWGRLKATAKIGGSKWPTAIWFDTKMKTYLLPIKADIRRKEKIEAGANVAVIVWI